MRREEARSKLTYANVMSTVAVVLALTGGATAIALTLPKNSVTSKQLAKGAVKTPDISKNAVTGAKAKESSFGKVPSAAHADTAGTADSAGHADSAARADSAAVADKVGSLPPQEIVGEKTVSSDSFTNRLELSVSGFPTFDLHCHLNEPGSGEDTLSFEHGSGQLTGALSSGLIAAQEYPGGTPTLLAISETIEGGSSDYTGIDGHILHVQFESTLVGSNKTILIRGGGIDAAGPGCAGQLHAFTVG